MRGIICRLYPEKGCTSSPELISTKTCMPVSVSNTNLFFQSRNFRLPLLLSIWGEMEHFSVLCFRIRTGNFEQEVYYCICKGKKSCNSFLLRNERYQRSPECHNRRLSRGTIEFPDIITVVCRWIWSRPSGPM